MAALKNRRRQPRPKKKTPDLRRLYSKFLDRQRQDWPGRTSDIHRERLGIISRLERAGVKSAEDLLNRLPSLPLALKRDAIGLVWLFKIRGAVPILLDLISDKSVRIHCATALRLLKSSPKAVRFLIEIGHRELQSSRPDVDWLWAVIEGLGFTDDRHAAELLVSIYERNDVCGWLRGEAADKLGCVSLVSDRRTQLYRRSRIAALKGLSNSSIHMQFWSMYLVGSLCGANRSWQKSRRSGFETALPKLRLIAAHDARLAPGYWWPMSAEAEDIIGCIETGCWPDPDAADRWLGNKNRGIWSRDV